MRAARRGRHGTLREIKKKKRVLTLVLHKDIKLESKGLLKPSKTAAEIAFLYKIGKGLSKYVRRESFQNL